jgi:hypothetical protein
MSRKLQKHWAELAAEDLKSFLETEPPILARAFTKGGRAPFSARTDERTKIEYYRSQFFNPDGTPNEVGRAQTLNRVGIDGYAEIYRALHDKNSVQEEDDEPPSNDAAGY